MARSAILEFIALSVVVAAFGAPTNPKQLVRRHQEWLNGPTSYVITKAERGAFLDLSTDEQRDLFIERFWEIRNPAQGSGTNEFKDEFYRRVEYANAHFGLYNGTEGWRSDMGKTYILFGRPQTSMNYMANQELHPIELWFYSNTGLSELPPFFYVMFFERDDISGYRFYNPLTDGPDKLLKAGGTKQQAYQYLRNISSELARASLTLIPGEPIDTDSYSGSMASVDVINGIQGYREMPSYVATVQARAARLALVTARVEYDVARTALVALVAREQGEPWVHWRMEIYDPFQPKAKDGRVTYEIEARLYSHNRLVFERTDTPGFAVAQGDTEALKKRPFVYQDRMPAVPGDYRLVVTAKSRATGRVYESARDVSVPMPSDRAAVSDILIVSEHQRDPRGLPFHFGGVKFSPAMGARVHAISGLEVLYQVAAGEARPAELEVEYVVGSVTTKFRKTYTDKLEMSGADAAGTLLTAKRLPIEDLSPGSYQLALRIKDPQTGRITGRSVAFTVLGSEEDPAPIVISRGGTDTPQWTAVSQYERALCWLAQDRPLEAVACLEVSWKLYQNPVTRILLQRLYERTGQRKALN